MNNPQNFKQERCNFGNSRTKPSIQLPLPLEPEGYSNASDTDGHTIISNMWGPEPVDFIPPSGDADEGI